MTGGWRFTGALAARRLPTSPLGLSRCVGVVVGSSAYLMARCSDLIPSLISPSVLAAVYRREAQPERLFPEHPLAPDGGPRLRPQQPDAENLHGRDSGLTR